MKKLIILGAITCITSFLGAQCPANRGYYRDGQYMQSQDRYYDDSRDNRLNRDERGMLDRDNRANRDNKAFYDRDNTDRRNMSRDDVRGYIDNRSMNRDDNSFNARNGMKNSQDRYTTEDDQKIYNDIRKSLGSKYDNVSVSVNNGNVLLRGYVDSQDDIDDITDQIDDIKGVRNINNQVMVQEDSDNRSSRY